MAGLIKAALSIYHGEIPGNLHFTAPNPAIPFGQYGLRVVDRLQPWPTDPDGAQSFLTGINSFGFGGTNAHVVLDTAPAMPAVRHSAPISGPPIFSPPMPRTRPIHAPVGPQSGSPACGGASTYRDFSAGSPGLPLPQLAATLGRYREHHPYRLGLAPRTMPSWQEQSTGFPGRRNAGGHGAGPDAGRGRTGAAGLRVLGHGAAVVGHGPGAAGRSPASRSSAPLWRKSTRCCPCIRAGVCSLNCSPRGRIADQ